MKKTDPLGCFESSEVAYDSPCGIATAVFYATTTSTEIILYDNNERAAGKELLHVYLNVGTCVFTPSSPKAVSNGIYVEIKTGMGGVTLDIEP